MTISWGDLYGNNLCCGEPTPIPSFAKVYDLWTSEVLGVFEGSFTGEVSYHGIESTNKS